MSPGPSRQRLADALGLAVVLLALLDLLRPSLLLLPTITAGGDTPCHYPVAVWLYERLLPQLRLHGWYPGAYLGQPILLYYFPFPFLLMAALAPLAGMPVAFKIGSALGVFLLPLFAYVALRRMRLPFPAPLLGAAAALVFLYVEDNPIWGGTIASTLTGEFSYTYGTGFALLFLGELWRARADGRTPLVPGLLLALTCYAHGYAVLWAGLSAAGLLLWDRWPLRALGWLAAVAAFAFAFAAPALLPLAADWGWTTPYDDAWIELSTRGLLPALLWPLFLLAGAGLAATLLGRRRAGGPDSPLLLLGWGAVTAAALVCAGPGLGVVDVRSAPFAQLALALCGAASLGLAISRLALADLAALGLLALAVAGADGSSRFLRYWVDWNYSGLEAKELWPAWRALNDRLRGSERDPRVEVEYDAAHERAGSVRVYETLPFFSGRSTLEGVHNQAGTMAHPVFYLASELFARSPNPFRGRYYSRFDPETALARLRLFNVGQVVALSPALTEALDASDAVVREARVAPYTVYRLRDPGPGYVEPLAYEPVRSAPQDWRDASYRWISRKPPNRALLVFTNDRRFGLTATDPWAAPPESPLPGGTRVESVLADEEIRIRTDRPGHPLLVKVAYHPRWRASGAAGPYLVSPGLMLVVPTQTDVRLWYAGRAWPDWLGIALVLAATVVALALAVRRRRPSRPDPGERPRRAGALRALPVLLVVALAGLRLLPGKPRPDPGPLYERASRAFAGESWEDAAELSRNAGPLLRAADPRRAELLCLEGEALLRAGHPREAALAFDTLLDEGGGAHRPQALYSGARAREAAGQPKGAEELRGELRTSHAGTPWAARLAHDEARSSP